MRSIADISGVTRVTGSICCVPKIWAMPSGLLSLGAVNYTWPIREEPADDRSRLKLILTSILAHIGTRHLQKRSRLVKTRKSTVLRLSELLTTGICHPQSSESYQPITLAFLKFFNMTASSLRGNGAATVDPGASKEVTSIATPTMDLVGEEARSIDPSVEKRVLRKIDLFLMPAMVIGQLIESILDATQKFTDSGAQATVWCTTIRLFWGVQRSSA